MHQILRVYQLSIDIYILPHYFVHVVTRETRKRNFNIKYLALINILIYCLRNFTVMSSNIEGLPSCYFSINFISKKINNNFLY